MCFGLKSAGADPELAAYRFDAVLLFDGEAPSPAPATCWHDLMQEGDAEHLPCLAARLSATRVLARRLSTAGPKEALEPLGTQPGGAPEAPWPAGLEPEDLAAALALLGVTAELRPTPGYPEGHFDAPAATDALLPGP